MSTELIVSIPSRGFWFFEGYANWSMKDGVLYSVSIPSRGFWFFEVTQDTTLAEISSVRFQSPRGDFGFLKAPDGAHDDGVIALGFNPLAGILVF